eukprot:SAG11_NODE_2600_length_3182_cov_3.935777_1_plen_88_part_00
MADRRREWQGDFRRIWRAIRILNTVSERTNIVLELHEMQSQPCGGNATDVWKRTTQTRNGKINSQAPMDAITVCVVALRLGASESDP